ncbi:MAG: SGNH/GDSL hydrolase family protein [Solirubrobacterales bacterium]|nr:SGNH/GDSL hydrolase family protein [Solirubrobacterales bacterium]
MRIGRLIAATAVALVAAAAAAVAAPTSGGSAASPNWVTAWAASPQIVTTGGLFSTTPASFDNQTVRNIVFSSVSGSKVRVRFTNGFGTQPLEIGGAAIGVAGKGAAVSGSDMPLTFGGRPTIQIPVGAEVLSDPVSLKVPALHDLAVSVYLPKASGAASGHGDAQQINYVAAGNHAGDPTAGAFTTTAPSWFFVDAVDVVAPARVAGTLVAFGDSITDGFQSTIGANLRWPNDIARRLLAHPGVTLSVADEGISGNRVLNSDVCCGINALARFDRDALERAGVKAVIVLEAINDIGFSVTPPLPATAPVTNVSADQLIAGYKQLIAEAHAAGVKIYGGTLTPFRGAAYWSAAGEVKRETVNSWILHSHAFDGVIDFAHAVADPLHPQYIRQAYNSGDHLHPNSAGYHAMAAAVNLAMVLNGL